MRFYTGHSLEHNRERPKALKEFLGNLKAEGERSITGCPFTYVPAGDSGVIFMTLMEAVGRKLIVIANFDDERGSWCRIELTEEGKKFLNS